MTIDYLSTWLYGQYFKMRQAVGVLQVFLLILRTTTNGESSYSLASSSLQNYCPYFKNRGPSKQEDLQNCTWFKENACCMNSELEYVFSTLKPLPGADKECNRNLNYLYCYICAPHQNTFFERSTLYVCEEFCDMIYNSCKKALLKGFLVQDLYSNGTEFCKARRFKTKKSSDGGCYEFDPNSRTSLGSVVRVTHITGLLFTCLLTQIIFTINVWCTNPNGHLLAWSCG